MERINGITLKVDRRRANKNRIVQDRNIHKMIQNGKEEEAIIALEKCIQDHPDNSAMQFDLGALYYNRGDKNIALKYLEKATTLSPKNLTYKKKLVDIYTELLYPRHLTIRLTNRCNLHCYICYRESLAGKEFDSLKMDNIYKLEKPIKFADTIDLTGNGETFLYPQLEQVLDYIYTVNLSKSVISIASNGSALSKKAAQMLTGHLKSMNISLNAASAITYNRDMKNGDFEKTLKRLDEFLSELNQSDRDKIQLHFVAHKNNYKEIPDFLMLAKKIGVSGISVWPYMTSIKEHLQDSLWNVKMEYNEIVDRTLLLSQSEGVKFIARRFFNEKNSLSQNCSQPHQTCIIEVNGDVKPCCQAGSYIIGNVYENDFESVWFGKEFEKLREVKYLAACRNCGPLFAIDDIKAHLSPIFYEGKEYLKMTNEELNYYNFNLNSHV